MAAPTSSIALDWQELKRVCLRHRILRLSLFGSAVRGELKPESDIDFLVEYEAGHRPHLVELQEIQDELTELCGGRKADLVNPKYLNPRLRDRILAEAELQYGAPAG
ncbi:MAG: nucleotidyltransferase family protein [Acidobacteriia bacterium]|nr:nucleotidyltransferase family protein [Terriglobia bacterium]